MNRSWFLLLLVVQSSTAFGSSVFLEYLLRRSDSYVGLRDADPYSTRSCTVDPYNKSFTIRNLKYYCTYRQLRNIFSSLSGAGEFPVGRLRGHSILGNDNYVESIWNGKNFYYKNGAVDSGTVTNTFLRRSELLTASIYRMIAPLDGKEVFRIDYKNDPYAYSFIDYLRQIQDNLYFGVITFRGLETFPMGYFFLETSY